MSEPQPTSAAIIPAAGHSRRLGLDKRSLRVNGVPLLSRTVAIAAEAGLDPVIVVCRPEDPVARRLVRDLPCHLVHRRDAAHDMAGSFRAALPHIPGASRGALVLLPDMPRVDVNMIVRLMSFTRSSIVAASYGPVIAPPVWFPRRRFDLLARAGDGLGGSIRKLARTDVVQFPPELRFDVDEWPDVDEMYGAPIRSALGDVPGHETDDVGVECDAG